MLQFSVFFYSFCIMQSW